MLFQPFQDCVGTQHTQVQKILNKKTVVLKKTKKKHFVVTGVDKAAVEDRQAADEML